MGRSAAKIRSGTESNSSSSSWSLRTGNICRIVLDMFSVVNRSPISAQVGLLSPRTGLLAAVRLETRARCTQRIQNQVAGQSGLGHHLARANHASVAPGVHRELLPLGPEHLAATAELVVLVPVDDQQGARTIQITLGLYSVANDNVNPFRSFHSLSPFYGVVRRRTWPPPWLARLSTWAVRVGLENAHCWRGKGVPGAFCAPRVP